MSFEDIDYLQDYIEKSKNPYLKELFINDVSFNIPDYIEPSKSIYINYNGSIKTDMLCLLIFNSVFSIRFFVNCLSKPLQSAN